MTKIASGRKLLLIGWDGADWGLLTPLLDRGMMPALDALIDRGTMARLSGLAPSLSPLLWTSIATGKRADKHGILSAIEPDLATGLHCPSRHGAGGLRPCGRFSTAGPCRPCDRLARLGSGPAPEGARGWSSPTGSPAPRTRWASPGRSSRVRLRPRGVATTRLAEFRVHPGDL